MNRILLIGNGFDLTHGLKTSYRDFLDSRKQIYCDSLKKSGTYKDEDITIVVNDAESSCFEYQNNCRHFNLTSIDDILKGEEFISIPDGQSIENVTQVSFDNKIYEKSYKKLHLEKWVDVEEEYYLLLQSIATNNDINQAILLNNGLHNLTLHLRDYLKKLPSPTYLEFMERLFRREIPSEIFTKKNSPVDPTVRNILVLNFNYTYTPGQYISQIINSGDENARYTHLMIHGTIHESECPPIFGFGDEMDDKYKILEGLNRSVFLDYMKSHSYSRNSNYRNLINFIEEDEYVVEILGHSCGISDRVMLNMLFEHRNCIGILPYYHMLQPTKLYEDSNYKDISQNISRHFNKKTQMREKLVPFDKCEPLPTL